MDWGDEAYLAPYRGRTSSDLGAVSATARRLGWLCRAVNGRLAQPPEDDSTRQRLRMFLDGRA